jgi:hypothetical protein
VKIFARLTSSGIELYQGKIGMVLYGIFTLVFLHAIDD